MPANTHRMGASETDNDGRPVHRMQTRRNAAQQLPPGPRGALEEIRRSAALNEERWASFFTAVLAGCQTDEDIAQAAELADVAYLEYQQRISSR